MAKTFYLDARDMDRYTAIGTQGAVTIVRYHEEPSTNRPDERPIGEIVNAWERSMFDFASYDIRYESMRTNQPFKQRPLAGVDRKQESTFGRRRWKGSFGSSYTR